jgi:hypothetical protein
VITGTKEDEILLLWLVRRKMMTEAQIGALRHFINNNDGDVPAWWVADMLDRYPDQPDVPPLMPVNVAATVIAYRNRKRP